LADLLEVQYAVSADGRRVAEAEVGSIVAARELVAAAIAAGSELAWAHSAADLSALGFSERPGYRRLVGPAMPKPMPTDVTELSADEDTAELCAAAYHGQWGHKTPDTWPLADLAGSTLLGLRRGGLIAGTCRITTAAGYIDAPGLIPHERDDAGYRMLLAAALSRIAAGQVIVESWGDSQDRVRACEQLGLTTAAYCPGWELDLVGQTEAVLPFLAHPTDCAGDNGQMIAAVGKFR